MELRGCVKTQPLSLFSFLFLLADAHHAAIFLVDHNHQARLHAVAELLACLRAVDKHQPAIAVALQAHRFKPCKTVGDWFRHRDDILIIEVNLRRTSVIAHNSCHPERCLKIFLFGNLSIGQFLDIVADKITVGYLIRNINSRCCRRHCVYVNREIIHLARRVARTQYRSRRCHCQNHCFFHYHILFLFHKAFPPYCGNGNPKLLQTSQ